MKWFKMDCDIQDNLDMRKLIDEWGWDWFGRYCAIVGKVGMLVTEHRQTFALQTNDGSPFPIRLLSNDLSTNVERLSNFCQYLADNRLIDQDSWNSKKLIFIPKLRERADEYTRKLLTNSRHSPDQEVEVEVEVDKIRTSSYTDNNKYEKIDLEQHLLEHWGREGKQGSGVMIQFVDLIRRTSREKVLEAIEIAGRYNKKSFAYVQAIVEPKNDHDKKVEEMKKIWEKKHGHE
jgi:hypothetical protein